MTPNVVKIHPDQTIESAARLMTRYSISSVIVSENDEIVGILTERDIMMRIVAVGQNPKKVTVREIMSPDIVSCKPSTPLVEACRTMQENRIKKLAVFDDKVLKGIVSLTDIAQRHPELMTKLMNMRRKRDIGGVEDIIGLITQEEGSHLEFKSSLRYDRETKQRNQALEMVVLKTICAFLNAEGGTLLIGLSDDNQVVGVNEDYTIIKSKNRDGFQNLLLSMVSNSIGNYYLQFVEVMFHNVLGKDLCQVNVSASLKPSYLTNKGKQEFYVRTGNNSRPFKISEATDYIGTRWG
jgi:predicted transcriptional regulator